MQQGAEASAVVLGGTPNHGVYANAERRPTTQFNGVGVLLKALNAQNGVGADEVTPGIRWMTLRSDSKDKYALAEGTWIDAKGSQRVSTRPVPR